MRKLILSVLFLCMGAVAVQGSTGKYFLDHSAVDQLFAEAVEVDPLAMHNMAPTVAAMQNNNVSIAAHDRDPAIAFILAWFVGPLGIHRAYLGTSTGTIVGYILTLGGCGIVAFVDWVVLLIGLVNDDIDQYVDNPSFFMW